MATLTNEQIQFLNNHGISENETFDATGLKKSDCLSAMADFGSKIAYGATPCKRGGHTLRDSSYHCVQCHPEYFSFNKRHNEGGFIYVAFSIEKGYIKIGCTKNVTSRAKTLREQNYGGFSDWVISYGKEVSELAGQIEFDVHKKLEEFKIDGEYLKDGKSQKSREMFCYPVEKAIKEIKKAISIRKA